MTAVVIKFQHRSSEKNTRKLIDMRIVLRPEGQFAKIVVERQEMDSLNNIIWVPANHTSTHEIIARALLVQMTEGDRGSVIEMNLGCLSD